VDSFSARIFPRWYVPKQLRHGFSVT